MECTQRYQDEITVGQTRIPTTPVSSIPGTYVGGSFAGQLDRYILIILHIPGPVAMPMGDYGQKQSSVIVMPDRLEWECEVPQGRVRCLGAQAQASSTCFKGAFTFQHFSLAKA